MKNVVTLLAVLLPLSCLPLAAQGTQSDEETIRKFPARFPEAWNRHDMKALVAMMTDDVDFVTVGATWLRGRDNFETYHARLHQGRFKESALTICGTDIRFLKPDVAVLHFSWKIAGDKNPDGTTRAPRSGLFTTVVTKRGNAWLISAAQNTNAVPAPPELEGIRVPSAAQCQSK